MNHQTSKTQQQQQEKAQSQDKDQHLRTWDLKTRLMFRLAYIVIRLLSSTYRYRVFGLEYREQAANHHKRKTFAIACWHGNSFAGVLGHAWQNFSPLCSHSKDGSMVAFLCERIGQKPVRGSSSRGGGEAREQLLQYLANGYNPAFTVDGPKGPIYDCKPGIIAVAKAGSCAILPLCAIGESNWVLRSWDKLHIPKPFSRVVIAYAKPLTIPNDADEKLFEDTRQALNSTLRAMQETTPKLFEDWDSGLKPARNRKAHPEGVPG
jgi:lysophospholipid acyltransferase (LPLAT)-like uncharacterized protein